jgi:short-subunit dehydrogenase
VIDVNLHGVVNGVLAAYPAMVERGRGHIVNTASGAGLAAPPFVTAYAATKHAVVGLSASLRAEAALHGVRISVLCPGSVETPILDRGPIAGLPPTATAPVTARSYLAVVRQRPVPADGFAQAALRRVARNQGVIVLPAPARALWYFQRLSPALMGLATKRIAARVDRRLIRAR